MDKVLKQRIIGALVLIVSTVVLWPLIFDQPNERFVSEQVETPEPPEFEPFDINEPVRPTNIETVESPEEPQISVTEVDDSKLLVENKKKLVEEKGAQEKSLPDSKANQSTTNNSSISENSQEKSVLQKTESLKSLNITTELTEQGLPKSWAVQVGVFSNRSNANRFREQLIKDYYRSDIKVVTNGDKTFAKVFVGPVVNKSQAQKLKTELDKKYHIKSLVFLYAP